MNNKTHLRLAVPVAAFLLARTAGAANLTWDANNTGAGQTNGAGAWLNANQWWDGSGNVTWTSGDDATFGGPATAGGAVTLASPTTVNSLTFNTFTGTYTLGTSGQAITLNSGITKNAGSGTASIISPITLGGNQTWLNNTGTLSTSNGTNLIDTGGYQLTVNGTGTTNFGVVSNAAVTLTGGGALIKNGTGRLNVGGVNTGFSGTVTVNGGVMQVHNNNEPIGLGNLTLNGGVISWYWGANYTRTLGTGNSQVQIPGGESGFAGSGTTGPTINIGTATWGTTYFNPSKFVLGDAGTGNAANTTFSSAINLNGAVRTILVPYGNSANGNVSTISGVLSNSTGTSGLTKEGGGRLNLNSANTFNGTTTISAGVLQLQHSLALQNSALDTTSSIAGAATSGLRTNQTALTLGGLIGNKNFAATGGVFSTTSGGYGSVGTLTLNPGSGFISHSYSGTIENGAANMALTKSGAGTQILSGSNTYSGATTVTGGVLRLDSANALPGGIADTGGTSALTLNGGVIGLGAGDFTRGTGTGVTQVRWLGSGGFAPYGADRAVNLGGALATATWNSGSFVPTGTNLILGAADAAHTIEFQNPIDLGNAARTVQVHNGSAAVDAVLSGLLTGAGGGLTKTGAGTLQLTQATAYTGATAVSAGTLELSGATAAITSSSGVSIASGATVLLGNTSALNNTNRLKDTGTVTMTGGTLNFSHTGGAADYSETTGALTVTGSGNKIITSRAAFGQTSTLTFASLSYTPGGLQFEGDALGLDARNRIYITAQSAGAITSATYFDPLNNVTAPAVYSLTDGIGPLSFDANVDVLGGIIPDGSAAVSIIQAGTSGNITLSAITTTINSLTQAASQAGTVELAGRILRTDLVIVGNPNAPLTIGTTPGEGTITPKVSGGSLTVNNNYAAPLLTIHSVIADHASASSFFKTGAGTVQITAGATYTGSTAVGAGTLALTGAGALPDASAVSLSDASSVINLSGISSSAETIGSLTGVSGSSVVLGTKTLGLNGISPSPFAGVISGSGGSLTLLSGATQELTGDNTFTGDVTIGAGGSLSVNKIQTNGAQPLGQGSSSIVMQGNVGSGSTLTYTGAGAGATNRGLSLTGGQGGTVNVTAGTLTVNGTLSGAANFHKSGAGTLTMSGGSTWSADGFVNAGTLVLGGDSSPGSNSLSAGNWTVAGGASMRLNTTGALETSTLTRNGTFNLEAGTLRTNAIAGSGAFVWGAGTIAPLSNLTEGSTDRTDPGGSPSGPVVREGTILDFSGNLTSSNGSTLDLGGLFTDNGLRYNQINISGALSLAAADELKININPYLLRPNTYTSTITGDWGTLRLVMADSITGTFDTITGIGTDYLGFAADPGSGGTDSFINPASLAMNTYYIEYRTSGVLSGAAVLFHYKVAGSVPEPGSAGLLLGGVLLLRAMRRVSSRARFMRAPGKGRSSGLRRRRHAHRAALDY
jgi:fibronectin-binding autotransporter adhesin